MKRLGIENVIEECNQGLEGKECDLSRFKYDLLYLTKMEVEDKVGYAAVLSMVENEMVYRPENDEMIAKEVSRFYKNRRIPILSFFYNLIGALISLFKRH